MDACTKYGVRPTRVELTSPELKKGARIMARTGRVERAMRVPRACVSVREPGEVSRHGARQQRRTLGSDILTMGFGQVFDSCVARVEVVRCVADYEALSFLLSCLVAWRSFDLT